MLEKKSIAQKVFMWSVTGIYLIGAILGQFLVPIFVIISTPEAGRFLESTGRYTHEDLQQHYLFLKGFGYTFALVNISFLIWHFRTKSYRNVILQSYCLWLLLGNLALVCVFFSLIFRPVY